MKRKISHSQNFINSIDLVEKLINLEEVDIQASDTVLDIGSGNGIFADVLIKKIAKKGELELIEIDNKLAQSLRKRFSGFKNVNVHNINFLSYELPKKPFKIFSNIPFNFTADILNKILDPSINLECAYLVMQKEALERWGGSQAYQDVGESLKSLLFYPYFKISEIYQFNRTDFSPVPSVDCVFAKFQKRIKPLIRKKEFNLYRDFICSISQVKTGEGIWKKVFTKNQLNYMYSNYALVPSRGLNTQKSKVILLVFDSFKNTIPKGKQELVKGASAYLDRLSSKLKKVHRTR